MRRRRSARVVGQHHVVARVAELHHRTVVPERAAQRPGAELALAEQVVPAVARDQQLPAVVPVEEVQVRPVVRDPLERAAVPGLEVQLALPLAEEVRQRGVDQQVPRAAEQLEVLPREPDHRPGALGHLHGVVHHAEDQLQVLVPAGQLAAQRAGVVARGLAGERLEQHHVEQRLGARLGVDLVAQPAAHVRRPAGPPLGGHDPQGQRALERDVRHDVQVRVLDVQRQPAPQRPLRRDVERPAVGGAGDHVVPVGGQRRAADAPLVAEQVELDLEGLARCGRPAARRCASGDRPGRSRRRGRCCPTAAPRRRRR